MDLTNFLQTQLQSPSSLPLYKQLALALTKAIETGQLRNGQRLPPERRLAEDLRLSRTTIVNAYRLLEQNGSVSSRIGSGTYIGEDAVAAPLPPMPWNQLLLPHLSSPLSSILRSLLAIPAAADSISLAAGMPDPALYPLDMLQQLQQPIPSSDLGYLPIEGYAPLRRELASWLKNRQLHLDAEDIMILSGSQQGLYLLCKCFISPGDSIVVESPTYLGAIQVFQAAGARLLTLPGPLNSQSLPFLEDYLVRYRPKLFYLGSSFQNPSGRSPDASMCQKFLDLAAKYHLVIVEDDAYGHLHYETPAPQPLKSRDHYGGVLYLGSASKIFFPGLRTGWLAAPREVLNRLAEEKQYADLHSNNLAQLCLAEYMRSGQADAHLRHIRVHYQRRRDALAQALKRHCSADLAFELPLGGFYLWCRLKGEGSAQALLYEAARQGVSFVPGEAFYADRAGSDYFRLCFATHDEAAMEIAAQRLGQALRNLRKHPRRHTIPAFRSGQPIL